MPIPITLTPADKLSLLMLCDIYEHLQIEREFDPKFIREAIYSGNTWGLGFQMSGIFGMTETPATVVTETSEIMDMWWRLELEFERLPPEEKEWLGSHIEIFSNNVRFPGFGGNDETEYLSAAQFFVGPLNRFASFKGRELDSHFPVVDAYRRMLPIYKQVVRRVGSQSLSAKDLAEILDAYIHPDSRKRS